MDESRVIPSPKTKAHAYKWTQKIPTYLEVLKSKNIVTNGLLVFAVIIVAGWGTLSYVGNLNADNCKIKTTEAVNKFSEEWNDIMSRASRSNRINIQPNISELQNIKRKVSDSTDFFPKHSSYIR